MRFLMAVLVLAAALFALSMPSTGAYQYVYRNQFNDSTIIKNLTFNATPYSQIVWINVSRRANVTAASFVFSGYNSTVTSYQENITSYGLSTLWTSGNNIIDNNWGTSGYCISDPCWIGLNYTRRNEMINIRWMASYKRNGDTYVTNYTLTSTCIAQNPIQIRMKSDNVGTKYVLAECCTTGWCNYTGEEGVGGWTSIFAYSTTTTPEIFEEGLYYNTTPSNITIDITSDGSKEYTNNTAWNTTATVTLNSTALAAINNYLKNTCTASWTNGNCTVTFNISSATPGILQISSISITENITYNFSVWGTDETSLSYITFNISTTNGTSTTTIQNISTNRTVDVDTIPIGSNTLYATSSGYTGRYYYFTNSRSADTNLSIYLLATSSGISETIYVTNTLGTPISGATVTIKYPFDSGIYSTVEQKTTDTTGTALAFLSPNKMYHFVISSGGYVSQVFNAVPNPTSPFIYVRLSTTGEGGASFINFSTIMGSISYRILPVNPYQNNTFNVSFEIADSNNSLEYIGLNLTWGNRTSICEKYTNSDPSGTLMYCTVPNVTGKYYVHAYFKKTGFDQVNIWGGGSSIFFLNFLLGLSQISETIRNSISDIGYWIAVIVVTIVICAAASRFTGGMPIAFLAVGIVSFAVAVNPGITIAETSGWLVVALMILTLLSLMVLRSYI